MSLFEAVLLLKTRVLRPVLEYISWSSWPGSLELIPRQLFTAVNNIIQKKSGSGMAPEPAYKLGRGLDSSPQVLEVALYCSHVGTPTLMPGDPDTLPPSAAA